MLTKKQKTINWILAVILLVLSIFFLFPVIWMLANSFKPDAAITADMNSIAAFIPPALNGNYFENYITILTDTNFLRYMLNTLGYAALLIVLGVIVNGLAGYALAKINFPFRDQWLLIIMMLLIVPTETVITIHFLIIAKAGLLNTVIGYVLPMIVNPFNIFLFRQVFVSLPDDVYEAAQLDFCSPVKYFFTMGLKKAEDSAARSLHSAGMVFLITGAGGSFSAVITAAGVSDAIKNLVSGISGNTALILFIAWFLGMAFRQITGSGTVASLTTFAIMLSVTAAIACHPVFLALACLDGALFGATVNDSGFWIVSNMAGLNFSGGLKTYTLGQAIASVVGIILIIVVGCISCLF